MEFIVDKENKKVKVVREFAAPVAQVWAAWTEAKLLDQWWAPKPWQAETKSMEFREGGRRLYAMVGPDGSKHWALADFSNIVPQKSFTATDAFCDEEGTVNEEFPRSIWHNTFEDKGDSTLVTTIINHRKLEDLEKIIEMGFKEGFTMALGNLDELFAKANA